jgi:hypothetical protein
VVDQAEEGEHVTRCTACDEDLPVDAFAFRSRSAGTRHSRCKQCVRSYQRQWYARNAEAHRSAARDGRRRRAAVNRGLISAAKSVPCADCGGRFATEQMDFDHIRGRKVAAVSQMKTMARWRLVAEIAKCDVVCVNCHRQRTRSRRLRREILLGAGWVPGESNPEPIG